MTQGSCLSPLRLRQRPERHQAQDHESPLPRLLRQAHVLNGRVSEVMYVYGKFVYIERAIASAFSSLASISPVSYLPTAFSTVVRSTPVI